MNTLKELNLQRNNIGDKGGKAIARMLKINRTLVRLNLSENSMGERAGQEFFKCITHNDVIE